jgi:hypothetical protein
MPSRHSCVGFVATIVTLASVAAAVYVLRAPLRNAAKIQRGDAAARVHGLMGEPDAVFLTTAELQSSILGPGSYVFADRSGRSGIRLDELPPVVTRAEWFEYASAGHLVYYDENGVAEVFWGGT